MRIYKLTHFYKFHPKGKFLLYFCYIYVLFLLAFLPSISFAQSDLNYFEFSPDSAKPINVAAFDAVYQSFRPSNDFLSGVDIWIDNAGSSSTANFYILNESNNAVVTKTVSIPYIAKKWGGQRFFIGFNEPIQVNSSQLYKIKLKSALPKLQMYYVNKADLLEHNAPYSNLNIIGSAYLAQAEQSLTFKFVLYERGDNLQPNVTNVSFSEIASDQMKIGFNSNEPVDYKIEYQKTYQSGGGGDARITNFSGIYNFCTEGTNFCIIDLPVLPDSTYNFQLYIKDPWGNQTVVSGSFESSQSGVFELSPAPTSTPQSNEIVISDVRIVDVTSRSVNIAWRTNIPAASRILISRDEAGQNVAARLGDSTFELEHFLGSGNVLLPQTFYYATIISDSFTNEIIGYKLTFSTLVQTANNQNNNPQQNQNNNTSTPDQNQNPNQNNSNSQSSSANQQDRSAGLPELEINFSASSTNGTSVEIRWKAPLSGEPKNGYRIDIFNEKYELVKQLKIEKGIYSTIIIGLNPGNYKAVVYANNDGVFEKVGKATAFVVQDNRSFLEKINITMIMIFIIILGVIAVGAGLFVKYRKVTKKEIN